MTSPASRRTVLLGAAALPVLPVPTASASPGAAEPFAVLCALCGDEGAEDPRLLPALRSLHGAWQARQCAALAFAAIPKERRAERQAQADRGAWTGPELDRAAAAVVSIPARTMFGVVAKAALMTRLISAEGYGAIHRSISVDLVNIVIPPGGVAA